MSNAKRRLVRLEKVIGIHGTAVQQWSDGEESVCPVGMGTMLRALIILCTQTSLAVGPDEPDKMRKLFAGRAWRKPPDDETLDALVGCVSELLTMPRDEREARIDEDFPESAWNDGESESEGSGYG